MKEHWCVCFAVTWDPLSPGPGGGVLATVLTGLPRLDSLSGAAFWAPHPKLLGLAAAQKEDLPHPMVSRRAISSPSKIAPGITIFVYYAQFGGVFRLEEATLRSRVLSCVDS